MCHACIIEGARREMLSRRNLFKGAAALGAASVAAGLSSAAPLLAQSAGSVVDLTHAYDETFPTFGGAPGIAYERAVRIEESGYQLYRLTIDEHTGTHVDAPLHFSADGMSVDEIPPQSLVCPLCVIDITLRAAEEANTMVLPDDIEKWVSAHGDVPAGACIAMHSGWAAKVNEPEYRSRPDGSFAFPGFSKAATDLLAEMDVAAIAVDTLSLDPGNSADFAVHYSWLPGGRYGIENLAGLADVPAAGATVFVGAPKHKRGTGGPARIMAIF
ncbi:cyclase family protein [Ponticoccus sp. SC2-23]|uniref:cyclase family protein n=1 Tax=Alexandriicola marinus TaxID=2081710 RepID=UPI000FD8B25F|nr:cyclase family protein [Alexandriicola marinus]MBM1220013.1 cyclase family protein [Ponticoccus sp. SC6-9]MBM1224699.1 cyclase family protein [Ponticoccus sp. SC6-15]MBM1228212.1 cyclase family protein [Ponticoccus sp. SC6-38]MBM1234150.1 cyclase family protein [Ponticoccus sp. SC6-45]MBM1238714.1 cyclase family protein [Ponticoccus sp. SC6-49]MBM1242495.1 cyclase family protein [Ponticoccus sp. SC2-64]MBM1247674.1 cyclase family protein [Ponticoccus sp. SC6-42]MBM1251667.1 cyclase famil